MRAGQCLHTHPCQHRQLTRETSTFPGGSTSSLPNSEQQVYKPHKPPTHMAQPERRSSWPPRSRIWLNVPRLPTRVSDSQRQTSQKQTANPSDTRQLHNFHKEAKPHRLKTGLRTGAFGWSKQGAALDLLPWLGHHSQPGPGTTAPRPTVARYSSGRRRWNIFSYCCDFFFSMVTKEPRVTPKHCSILIATGTCL